MDVSEIMTPNSSMVVLHARPPLGPPPERSSDSGLSRIPLFGENRDDILGILYAKDLFPAMTEAADRRLGRPPEADPPARTSSPRPRTPTTS